LWTLENVVGTERFRRAMADYLARYRFKHPTALDFRSSLEQSLGGDLGWFFDDYMAKGGLIDYTAGSIDLRSDGTLVWVMRQGTVPAPVEIVVMLADGTRKRLTWDGRGQITRFRFDLGSRVVRVEIDPERKLMAELDVLDNGVSVEPEVGAALTFGGRLAFWFQLLSQMIGLFG
jgi:aminopeptidase N